MRMLGFSRRLARDERGAALIYVSLALTVFMGFAALVIDGSRLFTLDTELQSAADAIALAGAAELDGNVGAIDRAKDAMDNLLENSQTFATGAAAITAYERRFLSGLPASDADPITSDFVVDEEAAGADSLARFVEVRIIDNDRREIETMFATAIGGDDSAAAGAVAVAGFTQGVCQFTPLFMCNPFETTSTSLAHFLEQMDSTAERRRIIALKKSGSGASYVPGNFGFLESQLGPGAKALGESLASVDPGTCFRQDGVETKTGSTNSVHRAINVRFDLYANGTPGSWKNSADFRPSVNVTKGYTIDGNGANAACKDNELTAPPTAMGFPVDSVIDPDTRLGNGDWDGNDDGTPDFEDYWDINHGNRDGIANDSPPNGWTNGNLPTRYEVYRWEIDNDEIPNKSASGGENGNPQCNTNSVSDEIDRRIIYAAVVNCIEQDLHGGSAENVPVLAFLKMFMTQPMTKIPGQSDEDDTLFVEMVDIVRPGFADVIVHDIVQLYR
jgi:hypothetical protein